MTLTVMHDAFIRARLAFERRPTEDSAAALRQTIVAICNRTLRREQITQELRSTLVAVSERAAVAKKDEIRDVAGDLEQTFFRLDRELAATRRTREVTTAPDQET